MRNLLEGHRIRSNALRRDTPMSSPRLAAVAFLAFLVWLLAAMGVVLVVVVDLAR